jgi:hypothetical protein
MNTQSPPYPTSLEDLEARRAIHNQTWGPSDLITVEQLRTLLAVGANVNLDLEATLAHERLSKDSFMSHELGLFYNDLYSASPIRPMGITSSDYLNHLFEPGDLVLVTEGNGQCAVWESQASPAIGSYKNSYYPYTIKPASLQIPQGIQGGFNIGNMVSQYKYLAMWSGDKDVRQLFPGIAERRLPVASVVSAGQCSTEILFRVDALTYYGWQQARNRLSITIQEQFGYAPPRFKIYASALLPNVESQQRLIYLNPRLL